MGTSVSRQSVPRRIWTWVSDGLTVKEIWSALTTWPPLSGLITAVVSRMLDDIDFGQAVFYGIMAAVGVALLLWAIILIKDYRTYRRPTLSASFARARFLTDPSDVSGVLLDFDIRNPGAETRVRDWGVTLLPLGGKTPIKGDVAFIETTMHLSDGTTVSPDECYSESEAVPHGGTHARKRLPVILLCSRLDDLMRPGTTVTVKCVDSWGVDQVFTTILDYYEDTKPSIGPAYTSRPETGVDLDVAMRKMLLDGLSPPDRLRDSRNWFREVLDAAMGGDIAARKQFVEVATIFRDASREYNKSGPGFWSDHELISKACRDLGIATPDVTYATPSAPDTAALPRPEPEEGDPET